jgi:hypothetical protein
MPATHRRRADPRRQPQWSAALVVPTTMALVEVL